MKPALQVADHSDIGSTPGRVECEALVFAGKPIAQVVVDDEMRVTVVGPIVVKEGFSIGVFRRGHGRCRRRRTVVDPVDHVPTVPGVVTTFPSPFKWGLTVIAFPLTGLILIGERSRHQFLVISLQGDFFRHETFERECECRRRLPIPFLSVCHFSLIGLHELLGGPVLSDYPVIIGTMADHHRRILHIGLV